MLIGGSLKSMNMPIEMWSFNSKWGTSQSSIKKLDSTTVADYTKRFKRINNLFIQDFFSLNAFYTPVAIAKADYPREVNKATESLGLLPEKPENQRCTWRKCVEGIYVFLNIKQEEL